MAEERSKQGAQLPTLNPESLDTTEDTAAVQVRMPPGRGAGGARESRGEVGLTPDGRLKSGRLAGLTLRAAIFTLSWPVLVDLVLNSLVGLTDTVLAAGISEPATDAIGNAAYNLWFIGLVFMALDVGATALISRSIGAGRMAVAGAALGQTVLLAAAAGVGLGLLAAAVTDPISGLMGMGPEAATDFRTYMHIIAIDIPAMSVLYAGIACLRGAGDTFSPMRAMIIVNIVNAICTWTLAGVDLKTTTVSGGIATTHVLLHNPFGFNLGVMGLGLGTFIAHTTGAAIIFFTLVRGTHGMRLRARRLRPHWHTLRRIVRVGLPNFYETLGMWAGNYLIILMVGWLGPGLVGAHNLAIRIEALSFQPGFAMGIAAAALAGQYLGAGSPRLARRAILVCAGAGSLIMGSMGLAFVTIPEKIVGVLSSQPTHLAITPKCLFITGLVQIPFAIGLVLRQAMRGAGDVKVVMWITWMTTYGVRLPLAYALSGVEIPIPSSLGGGVIHNPFRQTPSLSMLWVGLCSELVIRCIAFGWRFVQGGWAKARV